MNEQTLLLLIEDEPVIQFAMQDSLESGGYKVLCAGNGMEGLSALDKYHSNLAGLITDIRLGNGADGWTVARRARELNPEIRVLYVTADSAGDWSAKGVPMSLILQKPVVEAQLLTAISTLLIEGR